MRIFLLISFLAASAGAAQPKAPAPETPAIKVERLAAATGIADRDPAGEALVFPAGTPRVYIWTRISAKKAPVKIRHVYYLEGKKAAEAELAVNSTYYRCWSVKAVKPGRWKVDVTDEAGAVLSSIDFSVMP